MAPEVWENKNGYKGELADIFSAGAALFEMVVGNIAFGDAQSSNEYYKLITDKNKHQ